MTTAGAHPTPLTCLRLCPSGRGKRHPDRLCLEHLLGRADNDEFVLCPSEMCMYGLQLSHGLLEDRKQCQREGQGLSPHLWGRTAVPSGTAS